MAEETTAGIPAPGSQTGERIVAVLGSMALTSGFMGMSRKQYTLVFTDRRAIFAQLTSAMLKAVIAEARSEAKDAGGGFLKQWGAQIGASMSYAKRYWEMAPEAVLAENAGNFALAKGEIRDVRYKQGMIGDDTTNNSPDMVIIKTASDKYKLEVQGATLATAREAFGRAGIG
ncbi:MAG: hypothetical protein ACYC77_07715 [Coriobacteriia bacterium]